MDGVSDVLDVAGDPDVRADVPRPRRVDHQIRAVLVLYGFAEDVSLDTQLAEALLGEVVHHVGRLSVAVLDVELADSVDHLTCAVLLSFGSDHRIPDDPTASPSI